MSSDLFDSDDIDPLLGPLQDNGGPTFTHALLPGSPAIDAGLDSGAPLTTDQRGQPRIAGAHVDIGAFEVQALPNTAPQVACALPAVFSCTPAAGQPLVVNTSVTDPDNGQTLTLVLKVDDLVLDTQTVNSPANNTPVAFASVLFPPGVHNLAIEVSDGTESAACSTTITVNADTTAPVVDVASDLSVPASGPDGAVVSFATPAASDCAPPAPAVTCAPASGSLFAIGDTLVVCSATDAAGNPGQSTFTVHVKGAAEQLNDLLALVNGLSAPDIDAGTRKELAHDLEEALKEQAKGRLEKACKKLEEFARRADRKSPKKLAPAPAALLQTEAARIQAVLGCS